MKAIPWRNPLGVVAAGYAVVVFIAAMLLLGRHIQYVTHPADAMSSGGMSAFGDLLLGLFIGGLFLIPTFFLSWSSENRRQRTPDIPRFSWASALPHRFPWEFY